MSGRSSPSYKENSTPSSINRNPVENKINNNSNSNRNPPVNFSNIFYVSKKNNNNASKNNHNNEYSGAFN